MDCDIRIAKIGQVRERLDTSWDADRGSCCPRALEPDFLLPVTPKCVKILLTPGVSTYCGYLSIIHRIKLFHLSSGTCDDDRCCRCEHVSTDRMMSPLVRKAQILSICKMWN